MVCSHCEEHPWKLRSFNPDKRSVFALDESEEVGEELCYAYSQQREEDKTLSKRQDGEISDCATVTCSEQRPETHLEGSCLKEEANGKAFAGQATVRDSEQLCAGDREEQWSRQASKPKVTAGKLASIKKTSSKTFVVCGGNAAPL